MPARSHQVITPWAAARPKALPPVSSTAATSSTWALGSSRSVSRVPGPPPRTLTLATLPRGGRITVQPVRPSGSLQWPTARSSMPRLTGSLLAGRADGEAAGAGAGGGGAEDLAGEGGDFGGEDLVFFEHGHVAGVFEDEEAGATDLLGHVASGGERGQAVLVADGDQGGDVDALQDLGVVEVEQAGEDLGPDLDVGAGQGA